MDDLKTLTILFRTRDTLKEIIKEDVKGYGLNVTEFGTMEALYHKGPLSISQILKKVLIANSSMSYVLETLETKEYVQRKKNPKDKRSFVIELTEKGKTTFECMYDHHKKTIRARLDALSEDEEKTLQSLLKKIGKQYIL